MTSAISEPPPPAARLEPLGEPGWSDQVPAAVIALPTDHPRPASGYTPASECSVLPPEICPTLVPYAEAEERTAVLLAAFAILLARYSGEEQIVLGRILAAEPADIAGSKPKVDVHRFDFSNDPSFNQVFAQVLTQLQEDSGRACLQANPTAPQFLFHDATAEPQRMPAATPELLLRSVFSDAAVNCEWRFNAQLFAAATIRQMQDSFAELLRGIGENPEGRVGALPILVEAERQRLLYDWNQPLVTGAAYAGEYYFKAVAAHAARTPLATALIFNDRQMTFRELEDQSNQIAHYLIGCGAGTGFIVALCLPRSPELIAWILGVLKTGSIFLPLDPSYPPAQLRMLQQQSQPNLLVTNRQMRDGTVRDGAAFVCVETLAEELARQSVTAPDRSIAADAPAAILFTSGSTGAPKAIPKRHGEFTVKPAIISAFRLSSADRYIFKTSLDNTLIIREIFWPLITGGTMFIFPHEQTADPAALAGALAQHRITIVSLVPSLLRALLEQPVFATCDTLRHVACFGEPFLKESVERFKRCLNSEMSSVYGTTEAPSLCEWRCHADGSQPLGNLGHRLKNWQVYVLDARRQPVPVGVVGELFAGGPGLVAGYLNQPQLTGEKFLPHPFSPEAGARIYRTGDRVRWRADASLEFIGRGDDQVKIRGFRVEPGQTEAALLRHPDVAECAVVARPDRLGDNQLVAFLVSRQTTPDLYDLRRHLGALLPSHLVPAVFVPLATLPHRPNGKLDRKALPADLSGRLLPAEGAAPETEMEQRLAALWRDLLAMNRIGRHDSFFDLGGHSLLAARLMVEIEKQFGVKLPAATLLGSPTIELLAKRLSDKNWSPSWSSLVPLQPRGNRPPLFFIHGWGGDVFGHLNLAKLLPANQPSYGLQAIGLDGKSPRHTSLEAMAAHYVQEIMAFQPTGAIHLAGYSMGGLIAYEVAQQLRAQKREVALLGLLDSQPAGRVSWAFWGLVFFPSRMRFHFSEWWRLPLADRLQYLNGRRRAFARWLRQNLTLHISVRPPGTAEVFRAPGTPGATDYYFTLAKAYKVRPYPGTADCFVSERAEASWRKYWEKMVPGGVAFHVVSGDHLQMVFSPEHLPGLAKLLTQVLQSKQTDATRVRPPD